MLKKQTDACYAVYMRATLHTLILVLLMSSFNFVHAQQPGTAASLITENLSIGSRGAQVTALQSILNRDPDTRVLRTGYFGPLTRAAVIRFQEKYASEILVPVGLTRGNGRVGPYTRAKLNTLIVPVPGTVVKTQSPVLVPPIAPSTPITLSTSTLSIPTTPTSPPQNPNLKNLDKFITAIEERAIKQGLSATAISSIKEQIIKKAATTTDLRAEFLKTTQSKPRQSIQNNSYFGGLLATLEGTFNKIFMPEHARAATGTPFGGALLFAMLICDYEYFYLILVEPLPPSFPVFLTYIPFTQTYASFNIPDTAWLLGEYEPGAGACLIGACPYCFTFNADGMISPTTGSSAL